MHGVYSLLVLVVLATLALAAPAPLPKQSLTKRSFTVPRIRKTGYVRDPVSAMARAYRKYGWKSDTLAGNSLTTVSEGNSLTSSQGSSMTSSEDEGNTITITIAGLGSDGTSGGLFGFPDSSSTSSSASEVESSSVPETTSASLSTATSSSVSTETSTSATKSTADKAASSTSTVATSSSTSSPSSDDDQTGEVTATPADSGAEYLSTVSIGGQKLNLDFDTGSADLWVFSTALSSSEIGEHSAYNSSKSSTYEELDGYTFSLSYGDGSGAAGTVGTDTVDIGGATVTKQAVELATSVSSAFVDDASSDGLVGLGFSSLNSVSPRQQKTFFENIMSELDQPLFTADLAADGSGTYEFGTIDASKYTGTLMFTPVNSSSGFWQFDSTSYAIGTTKYVRTSSSPAIADTGTSLLLLDPEVIDAYYGEISSATYDSTTGGYVYECEADLPDFAVAVGDNYMASIPGANITFAEVNSTYCFGGVQSNSDSGLQIFGDVLFEHHFVVFNGESEVLGMAARA